MSFALCSGGRLVVDRSRQAPLSGRSLVPRSSWMPPMPDKRDQASKPAQATKTDAALAAPNPTETNTKELTSNSGLGVPSNMHSLTAGPRGPVLLEDYHLQEKLAQFNRERIPERVVHARGMTAKGWFETTHDITHLTSAKLFSEVGKKTEVAARFSTVTHERGSPESLRDVRGFSVKWYTEEGNWDLVGNNIPVFFVRDGMAFVDVNHATKPNPATGIQEGWRILDMLSHHPESTHILTWLLDLNGIPKNWRVLEGYGVNTYKLVNAEGKDTLVKFHFRPQGGAEFMNDEEAQMAGSENMRHSHATLDLVESIRGGDYPAWDFSIQTMDPAKQNDYRFDPLDDTKDWPESEFPLQPVGQMVLDQNVGNVFNENEQIAFNPSVLVPGITVSDDKLLHSRLLAYADAQRYRLGVNYLQLPINAPKFPYHNNANDGAMQWNSKTEEVNYWPSRVEHQGEVEPSRAATIVPEHLDGEKVKTDLPKVEQDDGYDFYQAGERWRNIISVDPARKETFIGHVVTWMSMPKCNEEVRKTWLGYWSKCDEGLGSLVAEELEKALSS